MWLCYCSPLKLLCFSPFPSLQTSSAHRGLEMSFVPTFVAQVANFCKIPSVFVFQIRVVSIEYVSGSFIVNK